MYLSILHCQHQGDVPQETHASLQRQCIRQRLWLPHEVMMPSCMRAAEHTMCVPDRKIQVGKLSLHPGQLACDVKDCRIPLRRHC